MKKPIRLEEYYFEVLDIRFPEFLTFQKKASLSPGKGKHEFYFHKKRTDKIAMRWIYTNRTRKKGVKSQFSVRCSIVGIFAEVKGQTSKERMDYAAKHGTPLLYNAIKKDVAKIISNSLIPKAQLPKLKFE